MTLRYSSAKATILLNMQAAAHAFERSPTSASWLVLTSWMLAYQQFHNLGDAAKEKAILETLTATPEEYLWPEKIVTGVTGLTLAECRRFT